MRVSGPVPSPERTQFRDEWIEFYHRLESEKEFPLRNKQVIHIGTVLLLYDRKYMYVYICGRVKIGIFTDKSFIHCKCEFYR